MTTKQRSTEKRLAEMFTAQRAEYDSRLAAMSRECAELIVAAKSKSNIQHWFSGIATATALGMFAIASWNLHATSSQQEETATQQSKMLAAQGTLGQALGSQASAIQQLGCNLMVGQAVSDMRNTPKAANRIYTTMAAAELSCNAVGVPVLARLAYLIDENPAGIPRDVARRAAQTLATQTQRNPDAARLAYDQAKLRQFYLTNGYSDFQTVSSVAPLNEEKTDFVLPPGALGFSDENEPKRNRIALETAESIRFERTPTSELQLSAGFSSLEKFIVSSMIRQRNFSETR